MLCSSQAECSPAPDSSSSRSRSSGILSPVVLLPDEVFGAAGPTLTGQYIFKNAVLIAAALVVASRVLKGPDAKR